MDGQAAIDNDTEVLKRIMMTLLSLAALAERVSTHPLRILVLWILRPAEAAAREFVGEDLQMQVGADIPAVRIGNSSADAMRLARSFRALAAAVGDELRWALRFTLRKVRANSQWPGRYRGQPFVPPPLTPPHKGEGNVAASMPRQKPSYLKQQSGPRDPPPPCGEGLGWGCPLDYRQAIALRLG